MRATLFVSALFAALAIAAPNPAPEAVEEGVMPRACPGVGKHCPSGEHWVWSLSCAPICGETLKLPIQCPKEKRCKDCGVKC